MSQKFTDNKNYKLQLFGTNILYLEYFDKAEITLEVIKEMNERGMELVKRKPFYTVVDLRNMYGNMTDDAKEFAAKDKEVNKLRICESILVNSLPIKILVDGYLKFNRPISPSKVFSRLHSCAIWMESKGCNIEDLVLMKQQLEKKSN